MKNKQITRAVLAAVLALLYSVLTTIAGPMMKEQVFSAGQISPVRFFACFFISFFMNLLLFVLFSRYLSKEGNNHFEEKNITGTHKQFAVVWLCIFLSWVPAYLLLYPGVLAYDMISQSASALTAITSNHHPVLHTALIRLFLNLGKNVFGSYEIGLGFLSLLQMIILSYALTRLVFLLKKKGVPTYLVIFSAVMSGVWYQNAVLSVTMIKDVLHAAFLVLFVCHFTEIVTDADGYMRQKHNLVILPIVSFFMFAFRNNGLHIYLFCFAGLFLLRFREFLRKRPVALAAVVLLPMVVFKIYSGPMFAALGIEQGEVREALSVPIQQLQRVAVYHWDELKPEQQYLMDYYIDNLAWMGKTRTSAYDPFIADPAKSCFYSDHYNEDPIAFWSFYVKTGTQFTKEYLIAFLSNTLGYWYPDYYGFSFVEFDNYSADSFYEPFHRQSIIRFPAMERINRELCYGLTCRKIPVLRVFVVPGFVTWILLYGIAFAMLRKRFVKEGLPLFLPLIAQYGIMLLAPMSSFRYSWPLYLLFPIILIVLFGNRRATDAEQVEKDDE